MCALYSVVEVRMQVYTPRGSCPCHGNAPGSVHGHVQLPAAGSKPQVRLLSMLDSTLHVGAWPHRAHRGLMTEVKGCSRNFDRIKEH